MDFPRLTCYKTAVNTVLYLFWGQTWASGWIFKNAIFPPLDRHLQTRGLVHCHTCRTGPVYTQHQSAQTSCWNQQVTVIMIFVAAMHTLLGCDSDLVGSEGLHHLGYTVLPDGLCESRPGRRVSKLGPTGEERMVTFGAHIHSCRGTCKKSFGAFIYFQPAKRHSI